ncbi:odorant receptor 131-2-like [Acipenser oxyrinchus oxyrinchus]|uniref:Odorant receptor 131-2-like n=1 Tax=Acipenser oxyrinchus oxyrinchus TaxID=40147 RepID=A0AAD8CY69_ACIOX|nr:odorant receptor 131-2-like [Acipenser oxyrinchus oxyrinchus]
MNSSSTEADNVSTAFIKNLIVVFLWFFINSVNGTLVVTFFKHRVFYENPRYILFIHMVVNDMLQLTLAVTLQVVSYIFYSINVSVCCFLLLMAQVSTMNAPLSLAGMAIERYVAICNPLRHSQICTVRRTHILIAVIWAAGLAPPASDLFILLAMQPIGFFHSSLLCYNLNIFRSPYLVYKNQASHSVYLSCVGVTVMYTYIRVMLASRSATTDRSSAAKARNTILLHGVQLLMCMLSYVMPLVEFALLGLFPAQRTIILFVNYLIAYVLPRFLSPIIYGVRDEKFRKHLKGYLFCKSTLLKEEPRTVHSLQVR